MSESNLKSDLFPCLESLNEPIFLLNDSGELLFANDTFFSFLGLDPAECNSLQPKDFWPDVGAQSFRESLFATTFQMSGGAEFPVKLALVTLESGHHMLRVTAGGPHLMSLAKFHGQRMETLGMMAGGIAHDINNIMTGILGHASYLLATLPKSGPHVESLVAIEDGAKKSALMTRQIVSFSKANTEESESEIDLSRLVESACNLLRGAISREFLLTFEIPRKPIFVLAIEGQLTQILINLVVNARDALDPNGEIRISLCEGTAGDEFCSDVGLFTDSQITTGYACISVIDNGQGIPEDVREHMFEAYYSTKEDKGTGLGLATVQAIVKRAGGAIEVTSEVGSGTEIRVYLPIVAREEGDERADTVRERKSPLRGNHERILVVDDEAPVRNVLSLSLERLGYLVEVAASGTEALEKYNSSEHGYDLVLLDMVMPDMSGKEVFFKMMEIDPEQRVLISSAYSSDDAIQLMLEGGGKGFIQKPYDVEELALRVRESLEN